MFLFTVLTQKNTHTILLLNKRVTLSVIIKHSTTMMKHRLTLVINYHSRFFIQSSMLYMWKQCGQKITARQNKEPTNPPSTGSV